MNNIKRKKPCPFYISELMRLADTKITATPAKLHEGITGVSHLEPELKRETRTNRQTGKSSYF